MARTTRAAVLAGAGTAGTRLGETMPRTPRVAIPASTRPWSQRRGFRPLGPRNAGDAESATHREGRAAREGDHAVVAEDDPRRRKPVQCQESGHCGKSRADENRAAVVAPDTDHGEEDRRRGGEEGRLTDRNKVHPRRNVDPLRTEDMCGGKGSRCHRRREHERGRKPISHETDIDSCW